MKTVEKAGVEIDDLFATVSKELIRSYEKRNLPEGVTLGQVNEEYKAMDKNPESRILIASLASVFVVMIGGLLALVFRRHEPLVMLVPTLLLMVVAVIWVSGPMTKKLMKDKEVLRKLNNTLMEFRNSVGGLNPAGENISRYDEVTVREVLVSLAKEVLKSEKVFDIIRLVPNRVISHIVGWGEQTIEQRRKLEETIQTAKDAFGLEFKKKEMDEIFARAEELRQSEVK